MKKSYTRSNYINPVAVFFDGSNDSLRDICEMLERGEKFFIEPKDGLKNVLSLMVKNKDSKKICIGVACTGSYVVVDTNGGSNFQFFAMSKEEFEQKYKNIEI